MDWLETNFRPYNPEHEVQVGLFRVPVPRVDMGAFREAVANALVHRDYHRLGAVHVRLDDEGLTISNPRAGGGRDPGQPADHRAALRQRVSAFMKLVVKTRAFHTGAVRACPAPAAAWFLLASAESPL